MTEKEFSKIMERLEDFYPNFYAGRDKEKIFSLWFPLFRDDRFEDVARAVTVIICTLKFPPSVAEIKQQIAEYRLEDQPTAIEAFQVISSAVDKASDRARAIEQFNTLTPLLRRLAGSPAQLVSWHRLSDEAFQTVVMSAIRESYSALAKREAKYYALPVGVQRAEQWRIDGPAAALPASPVTKSVEETLDEMDAAAREFRRKYLTAQENDTTARVKAFTAPMTDAELKEVEARRKASEEKRLERIKNDR